MSSKLHGITQRKHFPLVAGLTVAVLVLAIFGAVFTLIVRGPTANKPDPGPSQATAAPIHAISFDGAAGTGRAMYFACSRSLPSDIVVARQQFIYNPLVVMFGVVPQSDKSVVEVGYVSEPKGSPYDDMEVLYYENTCTFTVLVGNVQYGLPPFVPVGTQASLSASPTPGGRTFNSPTLAQIASGTWPLRLVHHGKAYSLRPHHTCVSTTPPVATVDKTNVIHVVETCD